MRDFEGRNYINGEWLSTSKSNVPLYDAGFLLGDGLFETIRFNNKNIFRCNKHLDRLFSGLELIRINCSKSKNEIKITFTSPSLPWLWGVCKPSSYSNCVTLYY